MGTSRQHRDSAKRLKCVLELTCQDSRRCAQIAFKGNHIQLNLMQIVSATHRFLQLHEVAPGVHGEHLCKSCDVRCLPCKRRRSRRVQIWRVFVEDFPHVVICYRHLLEDPSKLMPHDPVSLADEASQIRHHQAYARSRVDSRAPTTRGYLMIYDNARDYLYALFGAMKHETSTATSTPTICSHTEVEQSQS